MPELTYRVIPDGHDRPIRYGTDGNWAWSTHALADAIAMDVRQIRPDITCPLTIHVWPTRDSEHYRRPVPDEAERFEYPATRTS